MSSGLYARQSPGRGRIVLAIILALGMYFGLHYLFHLSLVMWLPGSWALPVLVFFMAMALYTLVAFGLTHFTRSFITWPLAVTSALWIGTLMYWVIALVLLTLLRLLLMIPLISGLNTTNTGIAVASITCGTIGGLLLLGIIQALRHRVVDVKLESRRVQRDLRIAVISDVHLGAILGKRFWSRVDRRLASLKPDVLLAAGDIIDLAPSLIPDHEKILARTFERQPTYIITGNHEYINGRDQCVEMLTRAGARPLPDTTLVDDTTGITVMGLEDYQGTALHGPRRGQLERMIAELPTRDSPDRRFTILMNHQPLEFDLVASAGIDMQVSGHTHGGQMWPFGMVTSTIFKGRDRGITRGGCSLLYTCAGTGTWGPPIRIGARPEIGLITIKRI